MMRTNQIFRERGCDTQGIAARIKWAEGGGRGGGGGGGGRGGGDGPRGEWDRVLSLPYA